MFDPHTAAVTVHQLERRREAAAHRRGARHLADQPRAPRPRGAAPQPTSARPVGARLLGGLRRLAGLRPA